MSQESNTAYLGPLFRVFHDPAIKIAGRAGVSSEDWTGEESVHVIVGSIQFLTEYWAEGLTSLLTVGQTPPSVPCH